MADADNYQIQAVAFSPTHVEVTFVEPRHINDRGVRIQTFQINPNGMEEQIADVLDAIAELIERYEIVERNPPQAIPSRRGPDNG